MKCRSRLCSLQVAWYHPVGLTEAAAPALAFSLGASGKANPHTPAALSESPSKQPSPEAVGWVWP